MLICRKNIPTEQSYPSQSVANRAEAGPVFVPSRPLSALGRQVMAESTDDRVTAYDELWYRGCPLT